MGVDHTTTGSDDPSENAEQTPAPDRRPPPPPDKPGSEGYPSRADSRAGAAAANTTDQPAATSTHERKSGTEAAIESPALNKTELDAHTSGEDQEDVSGRALKSTESASLVHGVPRDGGDGIPDDLIDADADGQTREGARQMARMPDATTEGPALERADRPHEVKPPLIVGDYYTNIPPTVQDRYLVRDQSNPVPVFDGSPVRDQVAQGVVGDCGIVATLGAVADHRPDAIKDAIRRVGEREYEVTLHEVSEAAPADPVARPTGDVKTYRVNDELPVRIDVPTRPPAGIQAESCGWPALMEKVIAAEDQTWDTAKKADWGQEWATKHKPAVDHDRANAGLGPSPNEAPMGYNRLDIGSTAYQRADLLAKLTGQEAEVRRIPGEQQGENALLDEFRDRLGVGKPVVVGTRGLRVTNERLPPGIYAGHAYEVTKIEGDKIHIRNPWGYDHPDPMDAKTFWEYYRRYSQGGTRDGHYTILK